MLSMKKLFPELKLVNRQIQHFFFILGVLYLLAGCTRDKTEADPAPPPPPLSKAKEIISFTFKSSNNTTQFITDVSAKIAGETITVTLDTGTDITNLVPTITYIGKSLTPNNETAQNFTNPITYTVTAEDGSTKTYTVKTELVKANQKVFIGSDDGYLHALNARTGGLIWKYKAGGAVNSSPTLVNNVVYVTSMDGYLHAIDAASGQVKWTYQVAGAIWLSSPVVSNGLVFFTSAMSIYTGHVNAVDTESGMLKWRNVHANTTNPVVSDGKLFVAGFGHLRVYDPMTGDLISNGGSATATNIVVENAKLYLETMSGLQCRNADNGNLIWYTENQPVGASSPSLHNGILLISMSTGVPEFFAAYDASTGNRKWYYTTYVSGSSPLPVKSAPAGMDSLVYPGFHRGALYALKADDGSRKWSFGNEGLEYWFSNPTVANNVVYVGSSDKNVYALNATTGAMIWKFATSGSAYSGPCVVDSDGTIYHSGESGAKQ